MFKKFRSRPLPSVALAVLSIALFTSTAAAGLYYAYSPLMVRFATGESYPQHAANWWKWALTQPAAVNPVLDTTGEHCQQGQSGRVFYLAGTFDGSPVERACDVPAGKTLVFPIVNAIAANFPGDTDTVEELRASIASVKDAENLEVTVDGIGIYRPRRFYEESPVFEFTLSDVFGAGLEGTPVAPAVDAGYYVAIPPLLGGKHTIHIYGEFEGLVVDVTYELDVAWF